MKPISTADFAQAVGISRQAAHRAFQSAAQGKSWKGFMLPVVALPGNRGGAGGKVWGLALDRCPAELKAKLGVFESPFEAPLRGALNGKVEPWQWEEQADRLRIIQPVLNLPKRSAERVEALRRIAAERHVVRGVPTRLAENTIRDWVRQHETKGPVALLPPRRSDAGKARVLITREWDRSIGLDEEKRLRIASRLSQMAAGYVAKGKSHRKLLMLCEARLIDLCEVAGCRLPTDQLRRVCKLNLKWAVRFDEYRKVALHDRDHKAFSDQHSPRISRSMEDVPMDVLFGDVHHVDMVIAPRSEPMTVKLIAWMDAASGYLWATPVLVNNRQGIKQEDVAKSLAQVCFCPWGGIAKTFILDNGSEYKGQVEAVARLAYLGSGLVLAS